MQVQRFLSSAWASVHGPSAPDALLVSLLENGFAGLGVSPGPRAVDWSAVLAAAADLPVRFAAVRAAGPLIERSSLVGFPSDSEGERQVALRAIGDAVKTARLLGVPLVVLDLGVVPVVGEVDAEDLGDPAFDWTHERAQALAARRKVGRDAAVDRGAVARRWRPLSTPFPLRGAAGAGEDVFAKGVSAAGALPAGALPAAP